MSNLKLIIREKRYLVFTPANVTFIRGDSSSKNVAINYSNGSNQTLTAGQELYVSGTVGNQGYLSVKVTNNTILSNSGSLLVTITHYPSASQTAQTINFNYDGSQVQIVFSYNSLPVTSNINLNTNNRTSYVIKTDDILSKVTDFDGDAITAVSLSTNVTGYVYKGVAYVAGTFVPMQDIADGFLIYAPLNQNGEYSKTVKYSVKDSFGNTSLQADLKITVGAAELIGYDCTKSYIKKYKYSDSNFIVKGSGKFVFRYMNLTPATTDGISIIDVQTNNSIFDAEVAYGNGNTLTVLIDKSSSEDKEYKLLSGSDNALWTFTCASNPSVTKIIFPQRLYFYRNNNIIFHANFLSVIFNYNGTNSYQYSWNNPVGAQMWINTESSRPAISHSGNYSTIQDNLDAGGTMPAVGTVLTGYSVDVTFNGVVYNFPFSIEIIDIPI